MRTRVEGHAANGLRRASLQNQEKTVFAAADQAGRMFLAGNGQVLRGEESQRYRSLFGGNEEHVGRLDVAAAAVVEIEDKVVFEDVVGAVIAELVRGLINGGAGALEFDKGADGGFVEVDEKVLGPFEAARETVRRAELFVAEPAFEAEPLEDFLEGVGIGEDKFDFFADFVTPVRRRAGGADGELVRRAFEGEEGAHGGLFGAGVARGGLRSERFGADAEELAVLGEAAVGGVEDKVEFVSPGREGLGTELFESADEGLRVVDFELDLSFAGHGLIVRKEGASAQWPATGAETEA